MGKKPDKETKAKSPSPAPETPEVPIIRPNAFELIRRKLKREKDARTAAWLLFPDLPTCTKELGLDEPKTKGKKGATPAPVDKGAPLRPAVSELRSRVASPVSDGEDGKRKVVLFNLNLREYEVKADEEAWVEGEHLGDTDNESEGSVRRFITDIGRLGKYREMYVQPVKRRSGLKSLKEGARGSKGTLPAVETRRASMKSK